MKARKLTRGGAALLHKWMLFACMLCLTAQAFGSEPRFVVTMRFEGNENRTLEFFDGRSHPQGPTVRLWQGQDVFSISLAASATGGLRKNTARLRGTLTIVRIRWTGDAQTPPPEVARWVISWNQWASLSAGSGVQYNNTNVSSASVLGQTPQGTYAESISHSSYGSRTGGRPQQDPWVGRDFFEVTRSDFTWNPAGWWETEENLLSRNIQMDVSAQITVPHGYNSANAALSLQAAVTNKFVTIGPETYKKGRDQAGNPIRVLNNPDEGDTAVRLTRKPLLFWLYEWTTDLTHQLDFKPSFEAWHPIGYGPANPSVSWTLTGAHDVELDVLRCRVRQHYGDYTPYNMPGLSDYSLRARVTDVVDGFTDIAEKRMRVHFPIEGWQCNLTILHPLPEHPAYPNNYQPDWNFVGMRMTSVPTGETRTFTVSQRRTISNAGTIGSEYSGQVGTEELKVAFKTYENIEIGVAYEVTCSEICSITMYPGFRYYILWAPEWEEKAGFCDIYGANGYQGQATWTAVKYLLLPGNFLSIRIYVNTQRVGD